MTFNETLLQARLRRKRTAIKDISNTCFITKIKLPYHEDQTRTLGYQ